MSLDLNEPVYKELASQYDEEVKAYSSYGHEVIFGMSFEFVSAEEKLLDIGIGTGLASIHFSEVGLKVYGLDDSQKMLAACQSKSFTEALKRCDIAREPIPYENHYFDHIVCCGVLHFVSDLTALFSEVKRVMRSGGIFAFTIAPQETSADSVEESTAWGVSIFKHSPQYTMKLLETNDMELLKEQRLLIKGVDKVNYDMILSVMICRCR
ncbi:MAG: class I SAM-dependent methyltransferase [Candidatus Sabulitectum sp.]|nr:class I SAM-dependent methyltransferase [Candidatus Sabulitectum sp.]